MDIILFQGLLLRTQRYILTCIKMVQATISFSKSTLHYGILVHFKFWNILKWLICTHIITVIWIVSCAWIQFWASSLPSCLIFRLLIISSQINEHDSHSNQGGVPLHSLVTFQRSLLPPPFRAEYSEGPDYVRFVVLTAVNMKTAVSWVVTLFSLPERSQTLPRKLLLLHWRWRQASGSFKMSVPSYHIWTHTL
jgi:hypothetical protein